MRLLLAAVIAAGALGMVAGCATPKEVRIAIARERGRAQEELAELRRYTDRKVSIILKTVDNTDARITAAKRELERKLVSVQKECQALSERISELREKVLYIEGKVDESRRHLYGNLQKVKEGIESAQSFCKLYVDLLDVQERDARAMLEEVKEAKNLTGLLDIEKRYLGKAAKTLGEWRQKLREKSKGD